MPTEADLIARMKDDDGGSSRIDVTGVIRRSRRRRLANQLAIGATATLAVVGLGMGALSGIGPGASSSFGSGEEATSEGGSSDTDSGADAPAAGVPFSDGGPPAVQGDGATDGVAQAPANKINLCEGALAEVATSPTGLELTAVFPDTAPSASGTIDGTVVMTNIGDRRVIGTTAAQPAITLSRDSTVLWHSNGFTTMIAVGVDLEPGESMEYPASFEPVRCQVQDDTRPSFRDDLPAVGAGTYTLSAAIDFVPDPSADPVNSLVTGPLSSIRLQ